MENHYFHQRVGNSHACHAPCPVETHVEYNRFTKNFLGIIALIRMFHKIQIMFGSPTNN